MKAFHLLLFDGSLIFPECILIFGLILLRMIDSTPAGFGLNVRLEPLLPSYRFLVKI
ncbi:hypothetical protein PHJA_001976100 [Phtheirospermum japonicum]|uniref:NAD(P)H-quinone oxidoreductase subunit 2 N-terminal domain-containing protein n=1 Tax=Phtheirospermum japonicum TaxID=374723 RepID=A0A830CJ92_9LAMI|nr:hypothetical protein PHJA_001976100 [Phtheirospermum japonicum]